MTPSAAEQWACLSDDGEMRCDAVTAVAFASSLITRSLHRMYHEREVEEKSDREEFRE